MKRNRQYLLSFSEDPVLETPGDGGCGVTRGLAGQGDLLVELCGGLIIQVGNLWLHWEEENKKAKALQKYGTRIDTFISRELVTSPDKEQHYYSFQMFWPLDERKFLNCLSPFFWSLPTL